MASAPATWSNRFIGNIISKQDLIIQRIRCNFTSKFSKMSATQVRLQLHQYIDHLDDRFLNAMFAMAQQYVDNEEVMGSVGEQNLTQKQFVEDARTSYSEHKNGKTHTQEAVALEIEKW